MPQAIRLAGVSILVESVEVTVELIGREHVGADGTRSWVGEVDSEGNPITKKQVKVALSDASQADKSIFETAFLTRPCAYRHHDETFFYTIPENFRSVEVPGEDGQGRYDLELTLNQV